MNSITKHSTSPLEMINSIWSHRTLIKQLTKREINGRYRGSFFSIAWSFFNPLLMLSIYTFVFSFVFQTRWGIDPQENSSDFAIILFVGLIIHSLLAEVLSRASTQILNHANYVKKVVFPLEILSVVNVASALFHTIISFAVLLVAMTFFSIVPSSSAILAPLTLLPIVPLLLGLSWIVSSLGVFIRDISQITSLAITALMFLAPMFYPIEVIPQELQKFILFNPITVPITETRNVLIFQRHPDWVAVSFYWLISLFISWFGFYCFQKSRKGFSDVV